MIPCIVIVGLALCWMGIETRWLTVDLRLIDTPDIQPEYDGSDTVFLDDYETQLNEAVYMRNYNIWLENQRKPTYTTKPMPSGTINPQDKWMAVEEDLQTRRNGEAIYQRMSYHETLKW